MTHLAAPPNRWPRTPFMFAVMFGMLAATDPIIHADVISDWNKTTITVTGSDSSSTPLTVTRVFAMVHVAQFDAVNAVHGVYSPYLVTIAAPGASSEAAAAQAAHRVLSKLFPAQSSLLNSALTKSLETIEEGSAKQAGIALGQNIGDSILRLRDGDSSNISLTYRNVAGPGRWVPTPPDSSPAFQPHWRCVATWTLRSPSQFRPVAPLALTNAQYAADLNEVKLIGKAGSTARTALQTEIARFHDDVHAFTLGNAARDAVNRRPLSLSDTARLFALMYCAAADAAIACWEAKYTYGYWRPITAIRGAANDNNPDTDPDAGWEPLLPTPPHPEYPSGHSAVIGAGAAVLAGVLGDEFTFTTTSSVVPGKPHSFSRFSDFTAEVVNARVYAGAHFRTANLNAAAMGVQIAQHLLQNYLIPGPQFEGTLQSGEFRLSQRTSGPLTQKLETSADLISWIPLLDYTRTDLSLQIRDPQAGTYPYRFYRSVSP